MLELILPAAALAALTMAMFLYTASMSTIGLLRGKLHRRQTLAPGLEAAPPWIDWPRRNYNNLLEMPVLFYAAIAIAIAAGVQDGLLVVLAWTYVGLRAGHTLVHVAVNQVEMRFALFLFSLIALAAIWARLVLAVI